MWSGVKYSSGRPATPVATRPAARSELPERGAEAMTYVACLIAFDPFGIAPALARRHPEVSWCRCHRVQQLGHGPSLAPSRSATLVAGRSAIDESGHCAHA